MRNKGDVKRYIDDGCGCYFGPDDEFSRWLTILNPKIGTLWLHIDESSFKNCSEFIHLLDIQYCFGSEGELQQEEQ